jgi:peroxiredoxin
MGGRRAHELLRAGSEAPEFSLPALGGEALSLQQLLARGPVVLGFFKVSCPVCQLAFPFLERIHQGSLQHGSLQVIGVSQDDARATAEFRREFGLSMPLLLDSAAEGYAVSNAYGISHVPTLYVVRPDGRVGEVSDGFSKRDITALGRMADVNPFLPGEYVPEWKSG